VVTLVPRATTGFSETRTQEEAMFLQDSTGGSLSERNGKSYARSATSFFSHHALPTGNAHRKEIGSLRDERNPSRSESAIHRRDLSSGKLPA